MKIVVYICGLLAAVGCAGASDGTLSAASVYAADSDVRPSDNAVIETADPVTETTSAVQKESPFPSLVVTMAESTVRRRDTSPLASMIPTGETNTASAPYSEASGGAGVSLGCVRAAATATQQCAYLTVRAPVAAEADTMCRRASRALSLYDNVTVRSQVTAAATEQLRSAVQQRLSENENGLRTCYAEGIGARMRRKGKVAFRLDFTADVCGATVRFAQATLPDRETRRCLKNILSQLGLARVGFNAIDAWAEAAIEFTYEKTRSQK